MSVLLTTASESTGSIRFILSVILFLGFCAGVIILQIFLSKKENKWTGLILPIISLCISVVATLGIASYETLTLTEQTVDQNGVTSEETVSESIKDNKTFPNLIFMTGSVFLLYNIPTAVFMAIYFSCREKQRQKKALEKMRVYDLE